MAIEEQLKSIILEQFKSVRAFTQAVGIPYSTIDNMLKRGIDGTAVSTVIAVCRLLNIDIDALAENRIEYKTTSDIKISRIDLTDKEITVALAYRDHPEHQSTIDKILDIESKTMKLRYAASSKNDEVGGTMTVSKETMKKIRESEGVSNDDDLV